MKRNSTFEKKFDEIFTKEKLLFYANKFKADIQIDNFFDFSPHKKIFIPKKDNELREINIPDIKTKIIQKVLQEELSENLKFSNRNYAYQKGKSPTKAINRVKNFIKFHNFILKTDIDDFFDSIDHSILLNQLQKIIMDKKILYMITLFLKNGSLFKGVWQDKFEGIYQGDVLSPILANIYLDPFDSYFENRVEFVRFADDLIFFAHSFEEIRKVLKQIEKFLNKLNLKLDQKKTYIKHKSKSFEYLGVLFNEKEKKYSIDNDRLMQKISKISKETKKLNLKDTIEKINEHIAGFHNYYLRVTNDTNQYDLLQEKQNEILINKIIYSKQNKLITNKNEFYNILALSKTYVVFNSEIFQTPYKDYASFIVNRAYELLKLQTPVKSAQKDIESKKKSFFKNYLRTTELVISKFSSYIYFSQGKIKVRAKDEPLQQIPFHKIKRLIITNKKTSISTYLIHKCAMEKVDIDFIDNNIPYAMITYFKSVSNEFYQKQLEFLSSNLALKYAKNLLFAKAKNQINLLKYFNLRRGDKSIIEDIIDMEKLLKKSITARDTKVLMGFEGQISQLYWNSFRIITKIDNFFRTHKNSKDVYNQILNYGYAILYNRIQSTLLKEGFNIYYSFLHANEYKKPSLVFDMIEVFRQPVVDREVISMITKHQKLTQNRGLLSDETKKLIVQNIQGRLGSFTKTRYGKTTYANLIGFEANSLKQAIINKEKNHKFFIVKY